MAIAIFLICVGLWLRAVEDRQSYAPTGGGATRQEPATVSEKPTEILRWLITVDHKDIGLVYVVFVIVSFASSGVTVVLTHTEGHAAADLPGNSSTTPR